MSRRHDPVGFVVFEMQDVGTGVEDGADAVSAEVLDGGEAVADDPVFDDPPDVLVGPPRPDEVEGLDPAVVGGLDKPPVHGIQRLAHDEHLRAVPVVPVQVHRDVHVHDIAVLQRPVVGYAVADNLVDGGAARLGEAVVVQRARIAPPHEGLAVGHRVDLVRGHAHLHAASGGVQHLPCGTAGGAHQHDLLRGLHLDDPREGRRRVFGLPVRRVGWKRDRLARQGALLHRLRHLPRGALFAGPDPARVPERRHLRRPHHLREAVLLDLGLGFGFGLGGGLGRGGGLGAEAAAAAAARLLFLKEHRGARERGGGADERRGAGGGHQGPEAAGGREETQDDEEGRDGGHTDGGRS
mmetsp:Transcript_14194/g.28313  ORF Transcript_14194/g.28313 Transcript_14194/m.28313 type:complete len:353 (+) Transcript_14194:391-1449(+)